MIYNQTQLDNGLTVVTGRMPGAVSCGAGIYVGVGGRYENRKNSGVSHFLEHLLFKGTRKRSYKKIKEDIEGVGGSFNGFTAEEFTCYFVKVLSKHLETGVDVLCDMMRNALLKAEDIERERTVILEEIKMYLDMPAQYVHEVLTRTLWPDQPLGMNLAGTRESVSGLKRRGIVAHKERYYHPKNMVVSVCGDVSHETVLDWIQDRMNYRVRRSPARYKSVGNGQSTPRTACVQQKTEQSHIALGFRSYARRDPRRYAQDLLNIITGANMSSRLFNEIREKRGLAYEVRSATSRYSDTGAFVVSAGCEPAKTGQTIRVILKELKKLSTGGVEARELERAKEYFRGQFELALEDTADHMLWLGERAISGEGLPDAKKILNAITALSADDIHRAAREIFQDKRMNLALVSPLSDDDTAGIKRGLHV